MRIESFILPEHDWVPNNLRQPVLLNRGAVHVGSWEEMAKEFEAAFAENGRPPQGRDGVDDYHLYERMDCRIQSVVSDESGSRIFSRAKS